jgi:hypothetical protein
VSDHLAFTRLAHTVAFHCLRQDQGRLAGVLDCSGVGGEDLDRVVATAGQTPDLVVAHLGDERARLVVLAEEVSRT